MSKVFYNGLSKYEVAEASDLLRKANRISMLGSSFILKIAKTGRKGTRKLTDEITCNIRIARIRGCFDIEVELEDYSYSSCLKLCEKLFGEMSRQRFGDTLYWRIRFDKFKAAFR